MCCYFMIFLGNADGKNQPEGTLGVVDHVIHELLQAAVNLVFEVLPNQFSSRIKGNYVCVWGGGRGTL